MTPPVTARRQQPQYSHAKRALVLCHGAVLETNHAPQPTFPSSRFPETLVLAAPDTDDRNSNQPLYSHRVPALVVDLIAIRRSVFSRSRVGRRTLGRMIGRPPFSTDASKKSTLPCGASVDWKSKAVLWRELKLGA